MYHSEKQKKDLVKAIALDHKDYKRIMRIANTWEGSHSRGDSFIVKNGTHNMCRYYLLQNPKFPVWLMENNDVRSPLGIYVARQNTEHWEINDRLSIAADTGKLPDNVSHVAVIRNRNIDKMLEYVQKAERSFGLSFVVIHDESGLMDDVACLGSREVKKCKIPDALSRLVYDGDYESRSINEMTRYVGDDTDMEHVKALYRYNAMKFCQDALESHSERLAEYQDAVIIGSANISSVIVRSLTCGHESEPLSADVYATDGMYCPQIIDNGSYNVPYDAEDMRAFTFLDTDDILDDICERIKTMNKVKEVLDIWRYAGSQDSEVLTKCMNLRIALTDKMFSEKSVRNFATGFTSIAHKYGIDSMVDSYYEGVPVEDIVA